MPIDKRRARANRSLTAHRGGSQPTTRQRHRQSPVPYTRQQATWQALAGSEQHGRRRRLNMGAGRPWRACGGARSPRRMSRVRMWEMRREAISAQFWVRRNVIRLQLIAIDETRIWLSPISPQTSSGSKQYAEPRRSSCGVSDEASAIVCVVCQCPVSVPSAQCVGSVQCTQHPKRTRALRVRIGQRRLRDLRPGAGAANGLRSKSPALRMASEREHTPSERQRARPPAKSGRPGKVPYAQSRHDRVTVARRAQIRVITEDATSRRCATR